MRICAAVVLAAIAASASAQSASELLRELKTKRQNLPGVHQEFEETRTVTGPHGPQTSHRQIIIDLAGKKWREQSVSGAGKRVRIFDGQDLFAFEDEEDEFMRVKRKGKEGEPEPALQGILELEYSKAKELARKPCGFTKEDHGCIVFEVPIKSWVVLERNNHQRRMTDGLCRLAMDSENGLLIGLNAHEKIDEERGSFTWDMLLVVKGMHYGKPPDLALFALPASGMREVTKLTEWDAARIRKQLAGKPAPELEVADIKRNPVSLAGLKGKTVLLDFWTTWCPPCLADAPVLDELYRKYSDKNLAIIGISVNEDRETVEGFLEKHAHQFPIVLTTENEMPRAYQLGLFPTYIVIDPNGTVNTAFDGDRGFGELRKHLAKAGMETH